MENIISSNPDISEIVTKYSPYLFEIKRRIFSTLVIAIVGGVVGFVFYENIIKFLIDLLALQSINLVFTSPFQFINLAFSCAIATGLIFVFPVIIFQILSFLQPALKRKELRMVMKFIPICIILFLVGFVVGFFIMKWQIIIFSQKSSSLGIGNVLDISNLINTVVIVSVFMGLAFQFPILLFFLMKFNVIHHDYLTKQRLWVYLGSFFFAMLLPSDSIIADILLAMPLVMLFESTLIMNRIFKN